jgi:hypothetical protein
MLSKQSAANFARVHAVALLELHMGLNPPHSDWFGSLNCSLTNTLRISVVLNTSLDNSRSSVSYICAPTLNINTGGLIVSSLNSSGCYSNKCWINVVRTVRFNRIFYWLYNPPGLKYPIDLRNWILLSQPLRWLYTLNIVLAISYILHNESSKFPYHSLGAILMQVSLQEGKMINANPLTDLLIQSQTAVILSYAKLWTVTVKLHTNLWLSTAR